MSRDILVDGYTLYVGDERGGTTERDDSGLYHRDMRHLSTLTTQLTEGELAPIGHEIREPNKREIVSADVGSGVNTVDDANATKQATVTTHVKQTVWEDRGLSQTVELANYATPFEGQVAIDFDVDFADLFEVRGFRSEIDRDVSVRVLDDGVTYQYGYGDVDDHEHSRSTTIHFNSPPDHLEPGSARFDVSLEPGERTTIGLSVQPSIDGESHGDVPGEDPGRADDRDPKLSIPAITTGEDRFDRVIERSARDLESLVTLTEHGPVALAGAPWFATVFGRDSLIAAYQMLPVAPSLARGTVKYLAAHRGTTVDGARDEEPGKIFHEERHGELADRGLIPHTPYYGTIDATALWVLLLGELWQWTDDDALVRELEPALDDALTWIDGARDRYVDDPFLYYDRSTGAGLLHKAWRDTPGSVQSPDGEIVDPPIASVEVQGFVYEAFRSGARLYEGVLSDRAKASALREDATRLARTFNEEFWVDDRSFYGVAKTGEGDVVTTLTSNVGHCLWTGIVPEDRCGTVVDTLLSDELFTGWGLRTMERSASGYSPTSYHLGSVWPHDTSLSALGLARYGRYDEAETIVRGLFEASTHFDNRRIPELFCGFTDDLRPKTYPTSCVPQAWSAGAPFALLRAAFGLTPRGTVENRPSFIAPEAIDPICTTASQH